MITRSYNSGKLIESKEIVLSRLFRQTTEYWNNVTIARQSINGKYIDFIRSIDDNLVEIGGTSSFQKYMSRGSCILLDIEDKPTNDVTANAECLPFTSGSIGGILCISVLEHTQNPKCVIEEIWRCLKPGGKVFISVPWLFEMHMEPHDFSRFSNFILDKWFDKFEILEIEPVNGYFGLLAHYMQNTKLLCWSIGTLFFWLDLLLKSDFRWTTQINLIARKPLDCSISLNVSNDLNSQWFDTLKCPRCVTKGGGVLILNQYTLICQSCDKKYPIVDKKRPVFEKSN